MCEGWGGRGSMCVVITVSWAPRCAESRVRVSQRQISPRLGTVGPLTSITGGKCRFRREGCNAISRKCRKTNLMRSTIFRTTESSFWPANRKRRTWAWFGLTPLPTHQSVRPRCGGRSGLPQRVCMRTKVGRDACGVLGAPDDGPLTGRSPGACEGARLPAWNRHYTPQAYSASQSEQRPTCRSRSQQCQPVVREVQSIQGN